SDVKRGRQPLLRIAELRQQLADHVEPEPALRQRQRGEPVELRLDRGILGGGEILQLWLLMRTEARRLVSRRERRGRRAGLAAKPRLFPIECIDVQIEMPAAPIASLRSLRSL